jgi:hypothetical protein
MSLNEIEQFANVVSSFGRQSDDAPVKAALVRRLDAETASINASAASEIKEAGFAPEDFLFPTREQMRTKREQQKLRHEEAVHQLELEHLRNLQAIELALKQGSVDRINGPVSVPVLAD